MLDEEANKNPEDYLKWYQEFQLFIKEGLAMDTTNQDQIMKICRYLVNFSDKPVSMEEYISKMPKE
jgi:HSP90 family molecular chaperone